MRALGHPWASLGELWKALRNQNFRNSGALGQPELRGTLGREGRKQGKGLVLRSQRFRRLNVEISGALRVIPGEGTLLKNPGYV